MHLGIKRRIKKAISTPDYVRILTLRTFGNFFIFFSLFTIGRVFYEPAGNEIRYLVDTIIEKKYVVANINPSPVVYNSSRNISSTVAPTALPTPQPNVIADLLNVQQIEVINPADTDFGIVIPKIAANVKVTPDVNVTDEAVYKEVLKGGVAHAAGTAYPGENGHVYLFAHSTDYWWNVGQYNAVFYLLYKLEAGDEVDIFYKGRRYLYRVIGQKVVEPSNVEYLTRTSDEEFLTLQTCWPPGTTLKRLLVFAVPVDRYQNGVISSSN